MTGLQRDRHTVFVDRNSGGLAFREHITKAAFDVVLHDEHFGASTRSTPSPPDNQWLVEIGKLGWLIVSGDTRTIREPLFLQDIPKSKAYVFLLANMNGGSPKDRANCLIEAYPKMVELIKGANRPSIWVFKNGKPSLFDWNSKVKSYEAYGRIPAVVSKRSQL